MDAKTWGREFQNASRGRDFETVRSLRAYIFRDTVASVNAGRYTAESGAVVELPDAAGMIAGTKFYTRPEHVSNIPAVYETEFAVVEQDCILAAVDAANEGLVPAVLNMASRSNPGGGVFGGAGAQEENLFRRSNLFLSLYRYASYAASYGLEQAKEHYPLDRNTGGIFTPQAVFFRGLEKDGYPYLEEPFCSAVLTAPALNHPDMITPTRMTPQHAAITGRKMRALFRMALLNGINAPILGAWGCGAFHNPPGHVAELFHKVLLTDEFRNKFAKVVFAIVEDHNSRKDHNPQGNFIPFKEEFDK